MEIGDAIDLADSMDLPDGAWWAFVEEQTGCYAGDIAQWLAENSNDASGDGGGR